MNSYKGREKSFCAAMILFVLCMLCNIGSHFLGGTISIILSIVAGISLVLGGIIILLLAY